MNPGNLVFGFNVPISVDPVNVYHIMLRAARYCQKRLGGQLYDKGANPLNELQEKQLLSDHLRKMQARNIPAGSFEARELF